MKFEIMVEETGNSTWYVVETQDASVFHLTKLKGYSSTTFSRPEKITIRKEGSNWIYDLHYLPGRFWDAVIEKIEAGVREGSTRN